MRLYVYDEQDERHGTHSAGDDATTITIPVRDIDGLRRALGRLIRENKTFRRVLWYTHGAPGLISFGKSDLTAAALRGLGGYEALFPQPTKMYFSGCNVASSDAGWLFLETAGQVFLRGGGYAMGWTSYGHGFKGETWRSWYNSHSMHFTGDVRIVTFRSGGSVQERLSYAGGWLTGNFFSRLLVTRKLEEIVPDDA